MPTYLISAEEQPGQTRRVHPAGSYRQCGRKGLHRALEYDGVMACPGCKRICRLPDGFKRGDEFITVVRPQE